ncbi:MFS transporter, partial [Aeromonas hydrophila]|uniref:MFS transporter n=1 Tax=Aeromonas hydrophila TaxID=644 RepID=UPI001C5DDB56
CLVYAMDLTVLNLALPVLSTELSPSSAQLLWILDIYGFFVAGFLITMGTLGDRIGRRRLLLLGAAFFAFASALAAMAHTAELLIAARALLGLAGATIAPSTMALIRNMFHDARQRQFAIGVWIATFSLGSAIGPLVGGVLLEYFHWGSVFWLNIPVMALTLALAPRFLPEYRDPSAGRMDLASVGLSLAAVLLTIYGPKQLDEHGPSTPALAGTALGLRV